MHLCLSTEQGTNLPVGNIHIHLRILHGHQLQQTVRLPGLGAADLALHGVLPGFLRTQFFAKEKKQKEERHFLHVKVIETLPPCTPSPRTSVPSLCSASFLIFGTWEPVQWFPCERRHLLLLREPRPGALDD